ncbi:MAG: hypothetical protein K6F58_01475 [Bacteroidales bacterium]|nr:hypothetical protein [Bacteroidales bacterium]
MKNGKTLLLCAIAALFCFSCERKPLLDPDSPVQADDGLFSMRGVARMLASLPIEADQINEVWDAVNASSGNGYDEEYMMCDLLSCPGAGVGDSPQARAASKASYSRPLRDLITDYLSDVAAKSGTRAGAADVEAWLEELSSSGLQIYWPYSEEWDGNQTPLITFDPGYGSTSNYAYEIAWNGGGYSVLDSVYVDENVAAGRPVWVINRNDDSGFTPLDLYTRAGSRMSSSDSFDMGDEDSHNNLFIKDFTMLRNYDSWFAGASEFFVQCGSVYADYADTEVKPGHFSPEITQLMIVVRRSQMGMRVPFEALLLSGFPDELDQVALLVTESDGGTRTSWKCAAKVMIKSKSYGIDLDIPFQINDDIVWRGPVSIDYLRKLGSDEGRFGDVRISFEVK